MNILKKFLRSQDGNAMIELAIILPVLIVLLLGVVDFGIILNQTLRVADSARAAALGSTVRAFATDNDLVVLVGNSSCSNIPGYNITSVDYCTCANGASTVSCSSHSNCGSYGIPNQYVKVTATATLPLLFSVTGFPANINIQSVAIARTPWTGTN